MSADSGDGKEHPFAEVAVIFAYGDREALADGTLIDLTPWGVRASDGRAVTRITSALLEDLGEFVAAVWAGVRDDAPSAETSARLVQRAVETLVAGAFDEEPDGPSPGRILTVPCPSAVSLDGALWLVAAPESGGLTFMRPEDY